ncbi:MAG: hypothetical protein NPIRA04_00990 [Nitrospirales bacterium]|nr:MAG: hypothetical protein NPIRA04_00990 [Nitrospirales bacterium]
MGESWAETTLDMLENDLHLTFEKHQAYSMIQQYAPTHKPSSLPTNKATSFQPHQPKPSIPTLSPIYLQYGDDERE